MSLAVAVAPLVPVLVALCCACAPSEPAGQEALAATGIAAPPPPPAPASPATLALAPPPAPAPRGPQDSQAAPAAGAFPTGAALDGSAGVLAAALALARADHPDLDEAAVRREIDALASSWRELAPADAPPEARADALARLLFEVAGFRAVSDLESPETLHIDSVLARREGYCLSLSVVALAMAEVLGEPLHGVAMPNHFLVRWDDGRVSRNLELTRRGASVSDAGLRATLGDFWHAGSIYARSLSPREVAAVLLHNRGFVAAAQGRPAQALADLERAAELLPSLPEAHRNLGVARAEGGDLPGAIASLETALSLYPGDVDALINLALARRATGDMAGARTELDTVLMLRPGDTRALSLLHEWAQASSPAARSLADPPPGLRPGLLGSYFAGTAFERLVAQRVDRELDFDWKRGAPLKGVPPDRFSVRWEGWLRAPEAGVHMFFVVANDGLRIRVGGHPVVDHWEDAGTSSWTGTGELSLAAGWHALAIELYDRSDNARLFCLLSRSGTEYPLDLGEQLFHQAP